VAPDHYRYPGQARCGYEHQIGIEIEGMRHGHFMPAQVASERNPAPVRLHFVKAVPGREFHQSWDLVQKFAAPCQASHIYLKAPAGQRTHHGGKLPFGPTSFQRICHEEKTGPAIHRGSILFCRSAQRVPSIATSAVTPSGTKLG
jgi:hypothetical protein